jgi:mannose-1-phosphate guanylyltransferase / mannose-6-phosphate isomerase
MKNIAVILSGGAGSRLWPLSRLSEPKQFQAFSNGTSLLAQTVLRANALPEINELLIVCSAAHQALVQKHCAPFTQKPITYLLEPIARNTAAAITCAAAYLLQRGDAPDACMLVLPSDHHMPDEKSLNAAVSNAIVAANKGHLITFGIAANKPETGFGYLEMGSSLDIKGVFQVKRFVEKPNLERAQEMLAHGGYSWNSGMFVMGAVRFLAEMERFEPLIAHACVASVQQAVKQQEFVYLALDPLKDCPSTSVDYAVFERSENVAMVSLNIPWSDLGSWAAVAEMNNAPADAVVVNVNAHRNYVHAQKTVALIGVSNLVVVDTPDALLISHCDETQDVRQVVAELTQQQPHLVASHVKVNRPWGSYESLDQGEQHQIKHIVVEPGGRLSLQSHLHRAEHWVVVQGEATITVGDTTATYAVGDHVFIQREQKHRLENLTPKPVAIVEVQIGSYLGEDDIIRYDDIYGRA